MSPVESDTLPEARIVLMILLCSHLAYARTVGHAHTDGRSGRVRETVCEHVLSELG